MRRMSRLFKLVNVQGFDRSTNVPFTSRYRVRCSQCQAMVVNGHPIHERGCPNEPRDEPEGAADEVARRLR